MKKINLFGYEIQIKKKINKPLKNLDGRPKIKLDKDQILLWKLAGKSNSEIARELGVSEGTIRNRLKE